MQEKYHIKQRNLPDFDFQVFVIQGWGQAAGYQPRPQAGG